MSNYILIVKLVILIKFFFVLNSFAQITDWKNYTYPIGAWDMVEDNRCKWVSTSGGLVKINKSDNSIELLNRSNSNLSYNNTSSLCLDYLGNLWVGSYSSSSKMGGISKYDGIRWTSFEMPDVFWSTYISGLASDKNNNIWFGMGQYIARYNGINVDYRMIKSDDLLSPFPRPIKDIFFDRKDNLWFFDGNINVLKRNNLDSLINSESTQFFKQDTLGNFWIIKNGKLMSFKGEDNIHLLKLKNALDTISYTDSISLPSNDSVLYFTIDKKNRFYLSYLNSLKILENQHWISLNKDNTGLPNGAVYFLNSDSENNLWGSFWKENEGFKIYKFDTERWQDITRLFCNSGLHSNRISSLAADNNDIWMVSNDTILTCYSNNKWNNYGNNSLRELSLIFKQAYDSDSLKIWCDSSVIVAYDVIKRDWSVHNNNLKQSGKIKIAQDGTIWLGTDHGIRKYEDGIWTTFLDDSAISTISFDITNTLYVGTLPQKVGNGYLLRFNGSDWERLIECTGARSSYNFITTMFFDAENILWYGVINRDEIGRESGGGIFKYSNRIVDNFNVLNSDIQSNSVFYITSSDNLDLWIGTFDGGLSRFDRKNSWTNYNVSNSPISGLSVDRIVFNSKGDIWASCFFDGLTVFANKRYTNTLPDLKGKSNEKKIFISPNPCSDKCYLSFCLDVLSDVAISIYSDKGDCICDLGHQSYDKGEHHVNLPITSNCPSGLYLINIEISKKKYIQKLVVSK